MPNNDKKTTAGAGNGSQTETKTAWELLPGETFEEAIERDPILWASVRCGI